MKKAMFVLLVLLTFIFMSCDTEPYIVGQVKNEKEFIQALNDPSQIEIMIKAGNYSFSESIDIDRDLKLYVENGTATINFKDKQDGIILTENSLTLSNLNIDGTLSIEDKEKAEPLAEITEVKIPRLILEGNTTIENLDIKKDVVIETTKVSTENPIKKVTIAQTVKEITLGGNIEDIPALKDAIVENEEIIKTGVARIGNTYYDSFADAVNEASKMKPEERIVEVLVDEVPSYNAHAPEINGSIIINANGANFSNKDVSIYTYQLNTTNLDNSNVEIIINDAKNLYLWGQPDAFIPDNTILNITLNNCQNVGKSATEQSGRMIYLTGTKGTTNVTLNNCSVEKVDSPCYTNNSGVITFNDCTFTECAVPLNFNMKAENGDKSIIIDSCTFDKCGITAEESASLAAYSAPIRVVASKDSKCALSVKNTSVTNTKGDNGDVLLAIVDSAYFKVDASFENNKTDLKVKNSFEEGSDFIVVTAGKTETI